MATKFKYPINLVPLSIENQPQIEIRDTLNNLPYLLDVETLSENKKILVNKPGGKRNFGRLSKHNFMIFIYDINEKELS